MGVLRIGESARRPLEIALTDDDPVLRREAAQMLSMLDQPTAALSDVQGQDSRPPRTAAMELPSWPRALTRNVLHRLRPDRPARPTEDPNEAKALILTPVKDAADCLDGYCERLGHLTYPPARISLGFLESDSVDGTFELLQRHLSGLRRRFRRVGLWKRDFGYRLPAGVHRGAEPHQIERRAVLAKSRNHLLFHALDDEDWVLWLDVDVIEYPPDLLERLLATGKDIVQPHCVLDHGGPTFDQNGWRDQGRLHLDDLRGQGEVVELDAVGATVLLVRADLHRDGLVFPSFLYGKESPRIRKDRGELETEGLGIMARDMGHVPWGMPDFEVVHRRS